MSSTKVQLNVSKVIVTYDLSPNDISAQEIADASRGVFNTMIVMNNSRSFLFPNTTLETSTMFTAEAAANAFKQALLAAKRAKGFSRATISRLFCCEVAGKGGYIENN